MKTWIGTTSATIAQTCAWVWKSNEPTPIAADDERQRLRRRGRRRVAASRQLTQAADEEGARSRRAFSGSDQ